MKISHIRGVNETYNNFNKNKIKQPNFSDYMKEENIEISQKGKDFSLAMEKLRALPDIREERVNSIKKQIEQGTYEIDSLKIARAMLLGEINA